MHDRLGARSEVFLSKTRREERIFTLKGRLTVHRYDRETGRLLGTHAADNTIQNKDAIIELLTGTRAISQRFGTGASGTGTAWLWIRDGSAATTKNISSPTSVAEVTASNSNGTRVRWVFQDNTTDTYDATRASLANGDPTVGGNWLISDITATGLGTKPSTENWHYYYEIELYSSDTDIKAAGTAKLMRLISGNVGYVAVFLTSGNTTMQPLDGSLANVGSAITASSLASPTTTSLEWTFVSADGSNNGAWANTRVQLAGTTTDTIREGGCKQDGTSCGTKASGEEWTYKWRFTLS
jgi:hypothetical protein